MLEVLCGSDVAVIYRVTATNLVRGGELWPHTQRDGRTENPLDNGLAVGHLREERLSIGERCMSRIFSPRHRSFPTSEMQFSTAVAQFSTPLLREGLPIGAIGIRRTEVHPFSEKQIALLKTFAAQAVIAIENVRLFKELEERNTELREALEHQTATAEVLGIISRSPTDVQPVFDAIVESAARVCGVDDVRLRLIEGEITFPGPFRSHPHHRG